MSPLLRIILSSVIIAAVAPAWLLLLGFLSWSPGWGGLAILVLLLPTLGVPVLVLVFSIADWQRDRLIRSSQVSDAQD